MTGLTINRIYQNLGDKPGCFRIRNTRTLEDWAVGNRFNWGWANDSLSHCTAMLLDGKRGVLEMLLDAHKPEWSLLSTKREIEWLKISPPAHQWQKLKHFYSLVRMRETMDKNGSMVRPKDGYF